MNPNSTANASPIRELARTLHAKAHYYLRRVAYMNRTNAKWIARALHSEASDNSSTQAAYWDEQLAGPAQSYLDDSPSVALRNQVVALLVQHLLDRPANVLDVACASGNLAKTLQSSNRLGRYVGIDISALAIRTATADPALAAAIEARSVTFEAIDLSAYRPSDPGLFDVIVFNEVLYYLPVESAVEQVQRYRSFLAPGGKLIVSMKDDGKSKAIFDLLCGQFHWADGVLFQEQPRGPRFCTRISREFPAYLVGLFEPKG